MAKELVTIFNKQTQTEQRIPKSIWENPDNKAAFQHCELRLTKAVKVVGQSKAPKKAETKIPKEATPKEK